MCFDFVQPVIDATFFHLYPPFLFEPVSDLFGGLELSTAQTIFERVDIVRLKRGLLSTVSPLEQGLYATRKIRFQPAANSSSALVERVSDLGACELSLLGHLQCQQAFLLMRFFIGFQSGLHLFGGGSSSNFSSFGHDFLQLVVRQLSSNFSLPQNRLKWN